MEKVEGAPWLYPLIADYQRRKLCECREKRYILDYQNRLVYCQTCGAIIDPFDALLHMARNAERIREYLEGYREAAEKERKAYMRYKGVNDITRKHRDGLIPVCPKCGDPIRPEEITTYINEAYVGGGD